MGFTIRPATMDDVPAIVAMAEQFYPASGYAELYGPMSRESAAGLAIVAMDSGVMLVAEGDDGALCAMACLCIEGFLFNVEIKVAHELAFWIEPDHRGGLLAARLLKAVDQACVDKGVTRTRMATLASSPEQAAALYQRRGYVPTESYFTKVH